MNAENQNINDLIESGLHQIDNGDTIAGEKARKMNLARIAERREKTVSLAQDD